MLDAILRKLQWRAIRRCFVVCNGRESKIMRPDCERGTMETIHTFFPLVLKRCRLYLTPTHKNGCPRGWSLLLELLATYTTYSCSTIIQPWQARECYFSTVRTTQSARLQTTSNVVEAGTLPLRWPTLLTFEAETINPLRTKTTWQFNLWLWLHWTRQR